MKFSLAACFTACLIAAVPAHAGTREKGRLLFEDRDGNTVGIPASGRGALSVTRDENTAAVARMPGDGRSGPIINDAGKCLTLQAPMDIRWARCELGANAQTWTRHAGGLRGSEPYNGQIDADARLQNGRLHVVRGEPGLELITDDFVPAND